MSYLKIEAGTPVLVRAPGAKPTDWRRHTTRVSLDAVTIVDQDRSAWIVEYRGWTIRVAKKAIESKVG